MNKFKPGDRVRAIHQNGNVEKGDILTVERSAISNGGFSFFFAKEKINTFTYDGSYIEQSFELVKSELEELVEKANEGYQAIKKLVEQHTTDFEHKSKFSNGFVPCIRDDWFYYEFRVKPKKKEFKPFTVKEGWEVSIQVEDLHIGCKVFDPVTLRSQLKNLLDGCMSAGVITARYDLFPTRYNINFKYNKKENYSLSYESAEQIIKALEEYYAT